MYYYVSMEKLLEHEIFKLKQLKRWLGEILATRVWPNGNYSVNHPLLFLVQSRSTVNMFILTTAILIIVLHWF